MTIDPKEQEVLLERLHEFQTKGDNRRAKNLDLLKALRRETDKWIAVLTARQRGPSGAELGGILDSLSTTALDQLRQRARKSTEYE